MLVSVNEQVLLELEALRAAGGAAHIRPVLFVIHVIHKLYLRDAIFDRR